MAQLQQWRENFVEWLAELRWANQTRSVKRIQLKGVRISQEAEDAVETGLIGCWHVIAIDMPNRSIQLIAGVPGEHVEFTADGKYLSGLERPTPADYRFRAKMESNLGELDIWQDELPREFGAECVYRIVGDTLSICIAGNHGKRPTDLCRDDSRLWCVMTFQRAERPRKRRAGQREKLLEPGSLVPRPLVRDISTRKRRSRGTTK